MLRTISILYSFFFSFIVLLLNCHYVNGNSLIYTPDYTDNTISAIDLSTTPHQVTSIPMPSGSGPKSVIFSPDGKRAYTANSDNGTVSVINTVTGIVIKTIDLTANACSNSMNSGLNRIVISPDGAFVYVGSYDTGDLFEVETATNTLASCVYTGGGISSIDISSDGSMVDVLHSEDLQSYPYDFNDSTPASYTFTKTSADFIAATVNPQGDLIYIADQTTGIIDIINAADLTDTGVTVDFSTDASTPAAISFMSDGSSAYVSCADAIVVINTDDDSYSTVPFTSASGIVFLSDGSSAYVTSSSAGSLTALNTSDHAVINTTVTGAGPLNPAITPDAPEVVVHRQFGIGGYNTIEWTRPGYPYALQYEVYRDRALTSKVADIAYGAKREVTDRGATAEQTDNYYVVAKNLYRTLAVGNSAADILAYTVKAGADNLTVVDTATDYGNPVALYAISGSMNSPRHIAFTPDGKTGYITSHTNNAVVILDIITKNTTSVPNISAPREAYCTPDSKFVYVTSTSSGNVIYVIDTSNNAVTSLDTGQPTRSMTASPDGKFIYAAQVMEVIILR